MEIGETIQRIISASGKSKGEVMQLINEKTQRFSGLLTENGAALMVAKELGVELGLERQTLERLKIGQLKDGMNNVELLARVKHVFSPRQFEKNGRRGILCNLIVADSSGEIRLTVWGKDVKKLEQEKVQKGSILLLKNCYVKSYNDVPQLNLSYNGSIEVKPDAEGTELPPGEERKLSLKELSSNESDVSVVARVLRMFPEKSFERESGKGRLLNFMLGDGTAIVRATAWDDMVNEVRKLNSGEAVKIEGAYTKEGLKGVELQLGFRARILREPEEGKGLPSPEEMQGIELQEKKVAGLQEGDKFVQLNAEIADILPGNLRFNVCPNCGKKVESVEGGYLCEGCGEVQPDIRAVVSLQLRDESGTINAVLFAGMAEKAIGLGREELKKRLEVNTAEQLIAELREKIAGKKVKASGFVKKNSFSNELEFNVKGFELV